MVVNVHDCVEYLYCCIIVFFLNDNLIKAAQNQFDEKQIRSEYFIRSFIEIKMENKINFQFVSTFKLFILIVSLNF